MPNKSDGTTTRRDNGAGSYHFSEARGCWVGALRLGNKRIYRYGPTKKTVQAKIKQARTQTTKPDKPALTVAVHAETWYAEVVAARLAPNTRSAYRHALDAQVLPALGPIALAALSLSDVQRWLTTATRADGQPLSTHSLQGYRSVLSLLLEHALHAGLIDHNPADHAQLPRRAPRAKYDPWSPAECRTFLTRLGDHPLRTLLLLDLTTGLRRCEIVRLEWSMIDFDRRLLRVPGTKTANALRTLPLIPAAIELLQRHRRAQAPPSPYVFPSPTTGRPWHLQTVSRLWSELLPTIGVRPIPFHGLRKSAATYLLAAGVDPSVLRVILGHARIATTLELYAKVQPQAVEQAMNAFGSLLVGEMVGEAPPPRTDAL